MFTTKIHHVKVASATVYGNTCKKSYYALLGCVRPEKRIRYVKLNIAMIDLNHRNEWFETSQCFLMFFR